MQPIPPEDKQTCSGTKRPGPASTLIHRGAQSGLLAPAPPGGVKIDFDGVVYAAQQTSDKAWTVVF
jgi:hypothetical protein